MLHYGDNNIIDEMMYRFESWMLENGIWFRRNIYNRFFTNIGTICFDDETLMNGRVYKITRNESGYKDIDFVKDLLILDKETALAV